MKLLTIMALHVLAYLPYLILFNSWDIRKPGAPVHDIEGHSGDINSLDFNPFNEYLFLTGSQDSTAALWDLRNTSKPLHKFEGHAGEVLKVEWEPNNSSIFSTCSTDRRLRVWDISKLGEQNINSNQAEGAPELIVSGFL